MDKRFSSTDGEHGSSLSPKLDAHLLNRDPPDHTRLRRLAAAAFTPRRIADLRPAVETTVSTLLDGLAGNDHAELIGSLASPLPLQVMHEPLGLPTQASVDFRTWTNTLLSADANQPAQSCPAMANMRRFLIEQVAHKRARPADDLLTGLPPACLPAFPGCGWPCLPATYGGGNRSEYADWSPCRCSCRRRA